MCGLGEMRQVVRMVGVLFHGIKGWMVCFANHNFYIYLFIFLVLVRSSNRVVYLVRNNITMLQSFTLGYIAALVKR